MRFLIPVLLLALLAVSCTSKKWEDIRPASTLCDTTGIISYSASIVTIVQHSCGSQDNNCHTFATQSGGVWLDSYSGIQAAAQSGQLHASITGDPHYSQMPQAGYTLDQCDRNKILRWVNEGAPNN